MHRMIPVLAKIAEQNYVTIPGMVACPLNLCSTYYWLDATKNVIVAEGQWNKDFLHNTQPSLSYNGGVCQQGLYIEARPENVSVRVWGK